MKEYRGYPPAAIGARKATTGICGLLQPGVHNDVAFGSFDVVKQTSPSIIIVLLLTGNVSKG